MKRYDRDSIQPHLTGSLSTWTFEDDTLVRTFKTGDWRRTNLLAGMIAFLGESVYHHPDLLMSYPKLVVHLTTHDAGGVTDRDLELARMIEEAATRRPGPDSPFESPPDWIE